MGWESNNIFQVVIIFGNNGGMFVYNAAGQLVDSIAFQANVDPLTKANLADIVSYTPGGGVATQVSASHVQWINTASPGNTHPQVVGIDNSTGGDLVLNSGTGTAAATAAVFSVQDSLFSGIGIPLAILTNSQFQILTGQAAKSLLVVQNITAAPSAPIQQITAQGAGDNCLAIGVNGDTINRIGIDSNGKITIGPGGAAARDTDLFRGGVGVLQTDSTFAITNQATPAVLAGAAQLFAASGQIAAENPQGLVLNLSGAQLATVNVNTVTGTTFANLASATVPAADAVIGATYKIRAKGNGTWGSTQQQLNLGARFGAAATNVVAQASINLAAFAASAAFTWQAEVEAQCVTTGAAGTWIVGITGCVTQTANPILPGSGSTNTVPFAIVTSAPITLDTTVAEILGVSASWGSTTGAPTISKRTSIYGRES